MEIVWKDIKGYEGYYQVSNTGEDTCVRSVDRYAKCRGGRLRLIKGRCVKQQKTHNYYRVELSKNCRTKKLFVQDIVAQAFPEICGEWFEGCEVHHRDFNPKNNKPENLLVLPKKEHYDIHKLEKQIRYKGRGKKVLQFDLEGNLIKEFNSLSEAGTETKLDKSAIYYFIKNGTKYPKRKNKYIWKYKE